MRYQQQPQPQFHESLTPTWIDLVDLVRETECDQVRGLYLHRRPGATDGRVEARFLGDMLEALAESEGGSLEADFAYLTDRIRTGAVTVDVAGLVGLAITVREEHGLIVIDGVFIDGVCHDVNAPPGGPIETKIVLPEHAANEENFLAAAMMGVLDTVIGDRHDQVTSALGDALALCLRNGFQAAIGVWEQDAGDYQARPLPSVGQSLMERQNAGIELEPALELTAADLRRQQRRRAKRAPRGFGWISYHPGAGTVPSITGITVLDDWVYFATLESGQTAPEWTVFPRPAAGGAERRLVDALGLVLSALHRRR
jgi:hypothetical protein